MPDIRRLRRNIIGLQVKVHTRNGLLPYINFDNAATTPPLKAAAQAVFSFLPWYSSIHRGAGYKSQLSTELYTRSRDYVTRFFTGDTDLYTTVFGKNATDAINKASYRFPLGNEDFVLSTRMEHHSNDLPWRLKRNTEYVELTPEGLLDLDHLEKKLKEGKVRLVTVCGASNVTGVINPIETITEMAHYYGAKILVDAAQLAAHRPLSTKSETIPDLLAISGHKIYAPFGAGALIGLKSIFSEGAPEYVGGGAVAAVSKERVIFAPAPDREEAGTPNLLGAYALAIALKWLREHDFSELASYEEKLTSYAYQRLAKIPGITIYGPSPAHHRRVGVISFNLEEIPHALLAAALAHEAGIGVRHGCFCARPYVHHLLNLAPERIRQYEKGIQKGSNSALPGMVRISFAFYNTVKEIDRLLEALEYIRAEGQKIKNRYHLVDSTGERVPTFKGSTQQLLAHLDLFGF